MTSHTISLIRAAFACSLLLLPAQILAQRAPASAEHLRFVLILSRHGVRAPTWTNARLDEFSLQPWPTWPVAPGVLTPHGKPLMTLFGRYDRLLLADNGLLPPVGCAAMDQVYLDADIDQRTVESARGLADGLEGVHEVGRAGQINRALRMSYAGEREKKNHRSDLADWTEERAGALTHGVRPPGYSWVVSSWGSEGRGIPAFGFSGRLFCSGL